MNAEQGFFYFQRERGLTQWKMIFVDQPPTFRQLLYKQLAQLTIDTIDYIGISRVKIVLGSR